MAPARKTKTEDQSTEMVAPEASSPEQPTETPIAAKVRRSDTKLAKVLELLARAEGTTIAEMMEATGWQAHYADARIMPM